MVVIGKYNELEVVKTVDFGLYLDGEELGEILLPTRYIPSGTLVGDKLKVMIYLDSEDRLIATTEKAYAQVGEFAYLEVDQVNNIGAFLNWGLSKHLLVPFREQKLTMQAGSSYIVYIYLDWETKRIAASAKLDKFLDNLPAQYELNEKVKLLVVSETDMGYKVIINQQHWGMVYRNEVFCPIAKGDTLEGYIKQIRPEDDKIDVCLQPIGFKRVLSLSERIMKDLKTEEGFVPLHDKSDAQEITERYQCSKKAFKQAIGTLYKERKIRLSDNGIHLI